MGIVTLSIRIPRKLRKSDERGRTWYYPVHNLIAPWQQNEPISQRSVNALKHTDSLPAQRPRRAGASSSLVAARAGRSSLLESHTVFPRHARLTRHTFPQGGRITQLSTTHFRAIIPPGRGYAIVIPKKVVRLAVDRHRLKRRIVGALPPPPPLPLPQACILYPLSGATNLSPQEMRAELETLFAHSGGMP